jgi:hypothetical protein
MQSTHTDKNLTTTSNAIANQSEGAKAKTLPAVPVLNNQTIQQKPDAEGEAPAEPLQLQAEENKTGMPDNLKSGVESLSGFSMNDVRVHYNSDKPKQLQALAYAQGTDIHIGPGQERHLPHEAWHVVQQQQGRVKPTMQMKGAGINDDKGLENEADQMGAKALQAKFEHQSACCCGNCAPGSVPTQLKAEPVIQRMVWLDPTQTTALEQLMDHTLDMMRDADEEEMPIYNTLYQAYNSFEQGSNVNATLEQLMNVTNGSTSTHVTDLHNGIANMLAQNALNRRTTNYPSTYNATANNARDTFQNGRLRPGNQWECPGNGGGRAAHDIGRDDITIDHILPCASQWNATGYNTTRVARNTWYNDTTNHRYMCRGCNSSLGSGGTVYRLDTGPNYAN